MAEKDTIYASKIKCKGVFNFSEFYKFCHNYLSDELGFGLSENEYSEKISGPVKNIDIKWLGEKKVSDYFKFEIKIDFKITAMSEVEVNIGGKKVKTNNGDVSVGVKGILAKDYDGKFETSAKMKVWRGIYEKWIISGRVKEFEDKLAGACDDFIRQAKAFLDLESK